jgi:hypothetical protein
MKSPLRPSNDPLATRQYTDVYYAEALLSVHIAGGFLKILTPRMMVTYSDRRGRAPKTYIVASFPNPECLSRAGRVLLVPHDVPVTVEDVRIAPLEAAFLNCQMVFASGEIVMTDTYHVKDLVRVVQKTLFPKDLVPSKHSSGDASEPSEDEAPDERRRRSGRLSANHHTPSLASREAPTSAVELQLALAAEAIAISDEKAKTELARRRAERAAAERERLVADALADEEEKKLATFVLEKKALDDEEGDTGGKKRRRSSTNVNEGAHDASPKKRRVGQETNPKKRRVEEKSGDELDDTPNPKRRHIETSPTKEELKREVILDL